MKYLFFVIVLLLNNCCYTQNNNNNSLKKSNFTCSTFVYNLSSEGMRIRDICYKIENTYHFDLNQNSGQQWDKKNDHYKFKVTINDNEKLTKSTTEVSFFIYENSEELIQYHCIYEDNEIKALIYDKIKQSWQILLFQNDDFKILSSYSGYNFINVFNIKSRKKSGINY